MYTTAHRFFRVLRASFVRIRSGISKQLPAALKSSTQRSCHSGRCFMSCAPVVKSPFSGYQLLTTRTDRTPVCIFEPLRSQTGLNRGRTDRFNNILDLPPAVSRIQILIWVSFFGHVVVTGFPNFIFIFQSIDYFMFLYWS